MLIIFFLEEHKEKIVRNKIMFSITPIQLIKRLCNRLVFVLLVTTMAVPLIGQTVVGTISKPGMQPTAVAVYEAGNKFFVADKTSGNVYIYDGTTLEELGFVYVGLDEVSEMVVDEEYGKLYACDIWLVPKIAVVDAATGTFIRHIVDLPVPGVSPLIVHDESLHKVYSTYGGKFFQIDVATDTVTSVPTITGGVADIAVNPVTHEVFMCGYQYDRLNIVDGVTLEHTIVPGLQGWGVGVNYLENKVYIGYYNMGEYNNTICIYDRETGSITPLQLDNDALNIVFNPMSNRMYTSSEIAEVSSIIEGGTDSYFNLPMQSPTSAPAIRYSTNHIYYAGLDNIGVLDDNSQLLELIPIDNPAAGEGGIKIQEIAINQTTGRVYVINDGLNLNFVTVIQDTEMMIRPPIYLTNFGFPSTIYMLDPTSKKVAEELNAPSFSFPDLYPINAHSMAVPPGGGRLYVPSNSMGFDGISIYAGCDYKACLTLFETGGYGSVVPAITPDGSQIYMTNSKSNTVSVIDIAGNSVITTVPVGAAPWGAAVTPDGSKVYVANNGDNSVSIIDTASYTVLNTIPVGTSPWGLFINPSGTKAYVANSGSDTVSVIDINSEEVIATVNVESTPHWLTVTPDGRHVYVSNTGSNTVSVIETGTNTLIQNVTVGSNPEGICAFPDGSEVYVGTDTTVTVISTSDYSVTHISIPPPFGWPDNENKIISLAVADPTSRFAGHVTAGGSLVRGALVRALQGGEEKGAATTNEAGDYSIYYLIPSIYDIEVSASDYFTQTLEDQTVEVGRTAILNFSLIPFLTVTSPNGEEEWVVNSSQTITWNSEGVVGNVKIEYSTNSGDAWTEIASSIANDWSYDWTIPNNPSSSCLVKISETDGKPSDVSDAVFTIVDPTSSGDTDGGDSEGGGGCFIATACYGTPMAEEVKILCAFRDQYLVTNPLGRDLVKLYYHLSPEVASFIRDKENLKIILRECLRPFIWLIREIVN